ncbi:MAG: VOC family protein [Ferruginibacter sp.]
MQNKLGRIIILVDDYDKALKFYETNFFCKKIFDSEGPNDQRYLHVGFSDHDSIGIWFLLADNDEQKNKIGKQTAGQPTFVIYTDACEKFYDHIKINEVTIVEELVSTPQSKFFHCLDLYGNRITIVELNS